MHHRVSYLERTVEDLREEDLHIKNDVERIKRELIDKTPEKFSKNDLLRSFIGSLFLGFSVIFSSNLITVASIMPERHIYLIIFFTIVVLSSEIFYIGYSRVQNKAERPLIQFWLKRISAYYFVAICVSIILIYIFGVIYLIKTPLELFNLLILMSTPCAIGASIGDLVKKY